MHSELLGPLDLAALASRLPASTSVPSAFQVLVTFDPEAGLDLRDSFEVGGSEVNVAGELRSEAATLRYTLVRLDGGS